MAFQKIEYDYRTLPTNTVLRFIEVEMFLGLNQLTKLFSHLKYPSLEAQKHFINYLAEDKHNLKHDLEQAFSSYKFRTPTREEIIQYFRYKNLGNAKVVKFANCSPNTLNNMKDHYPNFQPVFPMWLTFPVLLNRWEELKSTINIHNETLLHTAHTYIPIKEQTEYTPIQEEEKEIKIPNYAPLLRQKEAEALYLTPFTEYGMIKFAIATRGYLPSDYIERIDEGEFDISEVAQYLEDPILREKYQKQ